MEITPIYLNTILTASVKWCFIFNLYSIIIMRVTARCISPVIHKLFCSSLIAKSEPQRPPCPKQKSRTNEPVRGLSLYAAGAIKFIVYKKLSDGRFSPSKSYHPKKNLNFKKFKFLEIFEFSNAAKLKLWRN